jgi:hypothetical protein
MSVLIAVSLEASGTFKTPDIRDRHAVRLWIITWRHFFLAMAIVVTSRVIVRQIRRSIEVRAELDAVDGSAGRAGRADTLSFDTPKPTDATDC